MRCFEMPTDAMNITHTTDVFMYIMSSDDSDEGMALKLICANSCGSSNLISAFFERDVVLYISLVFKDIDVNRNHEHFVIVLETITRE